MKTMQLNVLTKDERALVQRMRKLKSEVARLETIPAALLEHGEVTPARAAKLLGVELTAVMALTKERVLPLLRGSRIPLSEVRLQFERQRRAHVRYLAHHLDETSLPQWAQTRWSPNELDDSGRDGCGFDVPEVARTLGISRAAAHELVTAGPVFSWRTARGGLFVPERELQAYQRKLAQASGERKAA